MSDCLSIYQIVLSQVIIIEMSEQKKSEKSGEEEQRQEEMGEEPEAKGEEEEVEGEVAVEKDKEQGQEEGEQEPPKVEGVIEVEPEQSDTKVEEPKDEGQRQKSNKSRSKSREGESKERSREKSNSKGKSLNKSKSNKSLNKQSRVDQIEEGELKQVSHVQSPKSTKSQKSPSNKINSPKHSQHSNNQQQRRSVKQESKPQEETQQREEIRQVASHVISQEQPRMSAQQLQSMLEERVRQIKQLKDQLKKEKQKNKLLEIELSAVKEEHSNCNNTKLHRPIPLTRNVMKEYKGVVAKKSKEEDDFWSIEPPEIIKRRNVQQEVYSSKDNSVISSRGLVKQSPLVRSKPSQSDYKQSSIRPKKLSQPIYDDEDEADFWSANLPQSLTKRKQDLLHDSNLWINQLNHHQPKNTKLPAISSGPLRIRK